MPLALPPPPPRTHGMNGEEVHGFVDGACSGLRARCGHVPVLKAHRFRVGVPGHANVPRRCCRWRSSFTPLFWLVSSGEWRGGGTMGERGESEIAESAALPDVFGSRPHGESGLNEHYCGNLEHKDCLSVSLCSI